MNELESLGLKDSAATKYGFFKRISVFFNKIFMLFNYIKILKIYKKELYEKYNVRVDDVYRMYTVVVIPTETMSLIAMKDNKYHMMFQQEVMTHITSYIKGLENFLTLIGINQECYGITSMDRIDDANYKVVISFALFDTVKIANVILGILLTISGIGLIGLITLIVHFFKSIF